MQLRPIHYNVLLRYSGVKFPLSPGMLTAQYQLADEGYIEHDFNKALNGHAWALTLKGRLQLYKVRKSLE